ncbi:MAG: hypothetical protein AAF844_05330 [Pseudomonadota bacterium]
MRLDRKSAAVMGLLLFASASQATVVPPSEPSTLPFDIAVAGIRIGTLELDVSQSNGRYTVGATGDYRVLFWGGELNATADGVLTADGPRPRSYALVNDDEDPSTTEIEFDPAGGATRWQRVPPAPAEWTEGRLPLQERHLQAAVDPVTALAASLLDSGTQAAPSVCTETLRVFTGFVVFELEFAAVRPGADGQVTCAATYRALSGHRDGSRSVRRLSKPNAIDVSFERLDDGMWVPSRVALPTAAGTLTITRS